MLQTKRDSTKSLFHSGAISLGEAKFHSPQANFLAKIVKYLTSFDVK